MISGATESSFKFLLPQLRLHKDVAIDFVPQRLIEQSPPIKILWAHLAADQPIYLGTDWNQITHIVCVSQWQKNQFIKCFGIDDEKITVIRNGGADYFRFSPNKTKTLIYASTPFRGLEYLPDIFVRVLDRHPDAELRVFSGMQLYGIDDNNEYEPIFKKLQSLPNTVYSPPIEHEQLAQEFARAAVFAYPNVWEETSCVTLIEALRSGVYPVVSDLGALPETAGPYGTVVKFTGQYRSEGWLPTADFVDRFADAVIAALDQIEQIDLYSMSQHACKYYDWQLISREWQRLIDNLVRAHSASRNPQLESLFIIK